MGVDRYLNLSDTESRALQACATVLLVPIKPQPGKRVARMIPAISGIHWIEEYDNGDPLGILSGGKPMTWKSNGNSIQAPCTPGDTLHLREAWTGANSDDGPVVCYRADTGRRYLNRESWPVDYSLYPGAKFCKWAADVESGLSASRGGGYIAARSMPTWAIRHHYPVKSISTLRVSEIGEQDALACGGWSYSKCPVHKNPQESLKVWWESRYPKLPWESSWAWKVEVER